ncbi:MAG: Competence protein ComEA-like protein with helix-hairpin-helix repeat region [Blastococcus sp.]|nr:Competence protein ComEA-like protein with helix-hairpin-helix repeat region [Blastococcus sp.]
MRLSSRDSDDADVIRARLRVLLDEGNRAGGWLPDELDGRDAEWNHLTAGPAGEEVEDGVTVPCEDPGEAADARSGLPAGIGRHRAPGPTPRWDPGRLGARSLWVAGLLAALLLVAWTWLERPHVEPAPNGSPVPVSTTPELPALPVGEASETSSTVVVSVVGLVARPGLVTLPTGARVAEAVEAAGGLLPDADPASVNLAAVVSDGEQVAVGSPGSGGASGSTGTGAAPGGLVDLNTATETELDALPGIGPVLAQRIVDHRSREGAFRSVDQLDDVPGIGPAIAAELAALVRV